MAVEYCNITTDLQRVFSRIEEYQAKEIIEPWTVSTSSEGEYKATGTGMVSMVFENGVQKDKYTTRGDLLTNGEGFYYDENLDVLYIITSGADDPSGYTIEVGEDWDAFKTAMRNKAQQIVDAYLNNKFSTPLAPRSVLVHDSSEYEYPIVRATALYTCYLIISRTNPNNPDAISLYKQFYNPIPEPGEIKGFINQILDGDIVLQDQISVREVGSWNIWACSGNSSNTVPFLSGTYTGDKYEEWKVEIDTAGSIGTATYKISQDGGDTWKETLQDTKDGEQLRMSLAGGIYIRFPDISYSLGDCWYIEVFPLTDTATNAKVSSISLTNGVRL